MPPTPTAARYSHNRCIVCAADNAVVLKIDDEEGLTKLLNFFWEGVSIDVKPLDAAKHHFCRPCSLKIIEFYDTNEVLLQLEKHLRSVQKTLILNFTQGIEKLKAEGHPLLPLHKSVFDKWGNGFKSEDEEEDKNSIKKETVTTYLEDGQGEGTSAGSSKNASNAPKPRILPKRAAKGRAVRVNDSESSSSESELPSDELDD